MAIPTETLRNMGRMHVWFAISSVAMLGSLLWMAWIDYNRPWHEYQDRYFATEASLAHLDYVESQRQQSIEALVEAQEALEQAKQQIQALDEQRQAAVAQYEKAKAEGVDKAELDALRAEVEAAPTRGWIHAQLEEQRKFFEETRIAYGSADAIIKVTESDYEHILGEYGPDDPKTLAAHEQLAREQEALAKLTREMEQIEDRQAKLGNLLKEIEAPIIEAQRVVDALAKPAADALKEEESYSDFLTHAVINAPGFDFSAPKGTPGRYEVKQLVLPKVRQQLNYLETYTTDRCTTCHVSIDDPNYSREMFAGNLESYLGAINEKRQREGQPAIAFPEAPDLSGDRKLEQGNVVEDWDLLAPAQRDAYFHELLSAVNTYLEDAGEEQLEFEQPLVAHPDLELFVSIDSPHPMKTFGCTVCHEGNPQETDFVLAAHSPANHEQEHHWKEEHYVTTAGVPNATFELVEHYWDRPMLQAKYAEANCGKCHTQITDIGEYEGEAHGRRIAYGEHLFTQSGCINCHLVEGNGDARRVGPDLTHVAAKLEPGFVDQWVFNPREFRPSTWMPHLFMQENNGPGSENQHDPKPVLRTETEVMAIRKYLFALSADWKPEQAPEGIAGDAENGRELFKSVGCLACHSNLHELGEQWITEHMQADGSKTEAQATADYAAMSLNQRVQYAWDEFANDRDTLFHPEEVRFDPEAEYNTPIFTRFGPELSSVGSKVTADWLYAWLRQPDAYSSETIMPSLRLSEQEAADIAAYLLTLKHDTFEATEFEHTRERQEMADHLVFTLLTSQRSAARSERIMNDANGELTGMLKAGLSRSPFAKEAAERIEAMDTETKRWVFLGSKMITHYGCYACHKIAGFETATRPGTELTTWAEKPIAQLDFAFFAPAFDEMREKNHETFAEMYPPDRDDLIRLAHGNEHQEILHSHASFVYHKLRNPRIWDREKIKKPYDKLKMPNFYFSKDETEALVTYMLGRRSPRVSPDLVVDYLGTGKGDIATGRRLTRQRNCVGCHQIEDNVATVHQYYRELISGTEYFDEINSPPNLRGEGAKVQPAWLQGFVHRVIMLRPWLKIRMPSFQLSVEETAHIVEYFASLSRDEADGLADRLRNVHAYRDRKQEQAVADTAETPQEKDKWPEPGADWYREPTLQNEAEYLASYALEHRLVGPFALDESLGEERLDQGYDDVFHRTDFLRNLYEVPVSFGDVPRALVPEERFHLGEQLVLELGCLKCHVMGDPNLEGSNSNPSAPNLNLTYQRLRQEWVDSWMRGPAWIQPGTKMPMLFPDGQSAFVDFGDYRAELEAKYGETADAQIDLLLDYLYNAGMTNHTTIDPVVAAAAAAQPSSGDDEFFEEGEDFDEDEEFFEEDE